ncbi:hypothetical protein HC024_02945 [Methylococcaceae bacterium WWC4]|nr:hypothetical protein [Methylococcaceae bacterium WWC4]
MNNIQTPKMPGYPESLIMTVKGSMAISDAATSGRLNRAVLTKHTLAPTVAAWPFRLDSVTHDQPRADIRVSSATGTAATGFPLVLKLTISELDGDGNIAPLPGACVDLWHSDGDGHYSGMTNPGGANLADEDFLRGYQATDHCGETKFFSVYPGWHDPETAHIQVRIRDYVHGRFSFDRATRLVFDEHSIDKIHTVISQFFPAGLTKNGEPIEDMVDDHAGMALVDEIANHPADRFMLKIAPGARFVSASVHLVIARGETLAELSRTALAES